MSQWGRHSYECDEVRDRVGDTWRELVALLPADVLYKTIESSFKQEHPTTTIGLLLWTFCGIELPEKKIRRLGELLTTHPIVAKALLAKIENPLLGNTIRAVLRPFSSNKDVLGGVISYFVHVLGARLDTDLRAQAVDYLQARAAKLRDLEEKTSISMEVESLQEAECPDDQ
jgi:hypothetical protein